MTKKVVLLLFVLMFSVSLAGCSKSNGSVKEKESDAPTSFNEEITEVETTEDPDEPAVDVQEENGTQEVIIEVETTDKPDLSSVDVQENNSTQEETSDKPDSGALFNGTYWNLGFGQSLGSNFEAKFNVDGTFLAYAYSGYSDSGTYKYENGILTVYYGSFRDTGVQFSAYEGGFKSMNQMPMQVGTDYYYITPSDGKWFIQQSQTN